jgi:hypothetical protein
MSRPASREHWRRLGADPVVIDVEEAGRRWKAEVAKLSRLALESGAKID